MIIYEYDESFKILGMEEEKNINETILNKKFREICNNLNNRLMEIQNKDTLMITAEDRILQTEMREKYEKVKKAYETIKKPEILAIRREILQNENSNSKNLFEFKEQEFNKGNKCIGNPEVKETGISTTVDERVILTEISRIEFSNGGVVNDTTLKNYVLTIMNNQTTGISYKFSSPDIEIAKFKNDENYRTEILKLINRNCIVENKKYIGAVRQLEDGTFAVINDEGQIDACKKLEKTNTVEQNENDNQEQIDVDVDLDR